MRTTRNRELPMHARQSNCAAFPQMAFKRRSCDPCLRSQSSDGCGAGSHLRRGGLNHQSTERMVSRRESIDTGKQRQLSTQP